MKTEECFVYINCCHFNGLEVSKIGITNNIEKRLKEFNHGLTYRARIFSDLTDIKLENVYRCLMPSRDVAKMVEKAAHKELSGLIITDFGREVFNVSSEQAILLIECLTHGYAHV